MDQVENNKIIQVSVSSAKKFDDMAMELGLIKKPLVPIHTFVFACKNLISDCDFIRQLLKLSDLEHYSYDKDGKDIIRRLYACLFLYIDQVDSLTIIDLYKSDMSLSDMLEYRRQSVYEQEIHKAGDSDNEILEESISQMSDTEYLAAFMAAQDEDAQDEDDRDEILKNAFIEMKEQLSILSQSVELSHNDNKKLIEDSESIITDYKNNLQIKEDIISELKEEIERKDAQILALKNKYSKVLSEFNNETVEKNNVEDISTVSVSNKKRGFFASLFKKNENSDTEDSRITYDDVILQSKNLSAEQLNVIVSAMEAGLEPKQLLDIADGNFSVEKMQQLVRVYGLKNQLVFQNKKITTSESLNPEEVVEETDNKEIIDDDVETKEDGMDSSSSGSSFSDEINTEAFDDYGQDEDFFDNDLY